MSIEMEEQYLEAVWGLSWALESDEGIDVEVLYEEDEVEKVPFIIWSDNPTSEEARNQYFQLLDFNPDSNVDFEYIGPSAEDIQNIISAAKLR